MSRVTFLIDGFNLYHALDYNVAPHTRDPYRYRKYKWLNLWRLASLYTSNVDGDSLQSVFYFTAFASWSSQKVSRHQLYINALENEGVRVVLGEFKAKNKRCNSCGQNFLTHEEKQTDVNIAVTLFQLAVEDHYDKVVIISGDTDILPAVRLVQTKFPQKQVGVIIPIGRDSHAFRNAADFRYKMRESHLAQCQFADPYVLMNGRTISRPVNWS